jgi:hypothetical protein
MSEPEPPLYDAIGAGYATTSQPDPRIEKAISIRACAPEAAHCVGGRTNRLVAAARVAAVAAPTPPIEAHRSTRRSSPP